MPIKFRERKRDKENIQADTHLQNWFQNKRAKAKQQKGQVVLEFMQALAEADQSKSPNDGDKGAPDLLN
jgi:hypothetical protein